MTLVWIHTLISSVLILLLISFFFWNFPIVSSGLHSSSWQFYFIIHLFIFFICRQLLHLCIVRIFIFSISLLISRFFLLSLFYHQYLYSIHFILLSVSLAICRRFAFEIDNTIFLSSWLHIHSYSPYSSFLISHFFLLVLFYHQYIYIRFISYFFLFLLRCAVYHSCSPCLLVLLSYLISANSLSSSSHHHHSYFFLVSNYSLLYLFFYFPHTDVWLFRQEQ